MRWAHDVVKNSTINKYKIQGSSETVEALAYLSTKHIPNKIDCCYRNVH